jgi:hypothetical protein
LRIGRGWPNNGRRIAKSLIMLTKSPRRSAAYLLARLLRRASQA